MAERDCRERGYGSVSVFVSEGLGEDLTTLESASLGARTDAVVLGDLGDGFTPEILNRIFRTLMDGAELVALQHNRYWRRADGLALDAGAYAAALEYASGREAVTVGKPARAFFWPPWETWGWSAASWLATMSRRTSAGRWRGPARDPGKDRQVPAGRPDSTRDADGDRGLDQGCPGLLAASASDARRRQRADCERASCPVERLRRLRPRHRRAAY